MDRPASCPSCGFENPAGTKFCGQCGQRLQAGCPRCGSENPAGFRFCGECGAALGEDARSPAPERDPRAYTPRHLADKILQSKSAIEGERKQVTVLFADVKGSMEVAEQVDAEEWHAILDRFFQILADGVHRFEGTVNQYTGDGIMALFGAPIAHEDHAQRACYAALHLRDELRRYADELRLQGLNFSVRMGLNSGEVIVGKIGDDLRMDYTAQGKTVGLAARMEEIAESGRAYLTQATERLVEGFFELRDLGELDVKGAGEPVRVYELERAGALRTRLDVARLRGFTRFVGRHDEMATLEAALHRALEGHGQVVGVVGEAGVGKSRLCSEFVERCRASGTRVLEARCLAYGKAVPFLPILELLRDSFGIGETDADQLAREKIAGRLLLDRAFDETLPLVFQFLGVADPDRPAPQVDPDTRQRQLFAFVRQLVQARSEREPAVLFFDDLHWIDPASDGFLAQLIEAVDSTRTLLLVNFRPEYAADWTRKSYYQQLALTPLGPKEVAAMVTDLLGSDGSVAPLPALIQERAGGNPFFTEEVVQTLVESGALEGERGAYRLVRRVQELEVPATVQALLAARIDRLPEREKQVLHTAAVIGRQFSEPLLAAVVELTDEDLASSLSRLQSGEFILEQAIYPMAEYVFKHPLTEQVARESQLTERRRRIHAAVARAIEVTHAGKLDEHAASLAHHWEQAGEALEAARWHRRSANWVATTNAVEALRHARRTGELIEDAAPGDDAADLELWAQTEIVRQAWRVGIPAHECEAAFARGCELALNRDDARSLAVLHVHRSMDDCLSSEEASRAVELGRQALDHATRSGDGGVQLSAAVSLILAEYIASGDNRVAEIGRRALREEPEDLALGSEHLGFSPYIFLLGYTGLLEAKGGRPRAALDDMERAERLAREHGQFEIECYCQYWLIGPVAELLGDTERGLACARRAIAAAEKTPSPMMQVYSNLTASMARYWAGAFESAESCAEQALEVSREAGIGVVDQSLMLALLAAARAALGEPEDARTLSERAVALADHRQGGALSVVVRLYRLQALLAAGEVASTEEIAGTLQDLERWIEERSWDGYRPFAHVGRAELARRRRDDADRERHLREAHHLFTEMGATGHAERVARELAAAES
jgi:class 3 adenylate cyclase/tetratricopeptide (TPR) repeat protein